MGINRKGFSYKGTYSSSTSYKIGEVVRYVSSSYVQLKDRQTNVTPGTDGTVWQLIAQGDTGAVLTTRVIYYFKIHHRATRLPIGAPGSVLTTAGLEPVKKVEVQMLNMFLTKFRLKP